MNFIKDLTNSLLKKTGYQLIKPNVLDIEKDFFEIQERVKNFTMTSFERQYALYKAVEYVAKNKIEGDIVECGVWKGGSSMISALTLRNNGITNKNLYLYDTFSGMSEPTEKDVNVNGKSSIKKWKELQKENGNEWDYASLEEVKRNLYSTHYSKDRMFFIKGKVEDTIPNTLPEKIAVLRLDTDWYESTKHELEHLFPRLVHGGVLIIDDYGHWQGARQAVDEYFGSSNTKPIFLNRIDYTGRIGVKV